MSRMLFVHFSAIASTSRSIPMNAADKRMQPRVRGRYLWPKMYVTGLFYEEWFYFIIFAPVTIAASFEKRSRCTGCCFVPGYREVYSGTYWLRETPDKEKA